MHRGASPASPGRLPLSTISSNSTPTAVPTAKSKGFFRNLVSNFAGDDRVPIDPSLYGSTVSSSPKPPVGAKIPKKKRVKKVTDSSKKRKQERRQRGTVLVDDFGFTINLASPDTPLEYEDVTPAKPKTPTRTLKSPSSKAKSKSKTRHTPTKSTPRELINGDKVGKKVMSIERKILNKAQKPPLPAVPKRKEVRQNYKIGGKLVKQNLSIDTVEAPPFPPKDSTPKGFMSSSSSISSDDTPLQSNTNTVLMPVTSLLQRQQTPLQHTEVSPMSRGDDDTVCSTTTIQSPVNVSLSRVELNTSVKRALKNVKSPEPDDSMREEERRLREVTEFDMNVLDTTNPNQSINQSISRVNISVSTPSIIKFSRMETPPSVRNAVMDKRYNDSVILENSVESEVESEGESDNTKFKLLKALTILTMLSFIILLSSSKFIHDPETIILPPPTSTNSNPNVQPKPHDSTYSSIPNVNVKGKTLTIFKQKFKTLATSSPFKSTILSYLFLGFVGNYLSSGLTSLPYVGVIAKAVGNWTVKTVGMRRCMRVMREWRRFKVRGWKVLKVVGGKIGVIKA
ncbi:hypothetical protein TL16_g09073 [Triparma laevis f. inornata]|uniref:Uncharacterized protein n=2 Tax=Triparma laevis TaxID=1534972 RepID=A0A9W7FHD7_9STRA|nr:hypothetical protein TL16_g09073 [Triparma laevis f. inornata]GMI12121.1 hypothetical protein TrLO_g2650 [Triparma laevis f. longispina]